MLLQVFILSFLTSLASCSIIDTRPWPSPVREYYDATIKQRSASPGIVSASCTAAAGASTLMPTGTSNPLPPPSDGLSVYQVVVGRGTQNYTCPAGNSTAAPIAVGAVAELFDTNCQALLTPAILHLAPRVAALYPRSPTYPPFPLSKKSSSLIGHHYFVDLTTATFNLNTDGPSGDLGIAFSKKIANTTAPATAGVGADGSKAVPWLKLQVEGSTALSEKLLSENTNGIKEIYRIHTAGGAAPATCAGMPASFTKEYSAEYWFWH